MYPLQRDWPRFGLPNSAAVVFTSSLLQNLVIRYSKSIQPFPAKFHRLAASKTWTRALDPDPDKPGP